jgi:hypothetical protein
MGEWGYSSTFLDLGTKMAVSGQLHAPAPLPPVPIGLAWTPRREKYCTAENLTRFYRLSYPAVDTLKFSVGHLRLPSFVL